MKKLCRLHRLPRPCRECAAANSRPRKRFLGTPRPGWHAVLPADQPCTLAPDWTAGVRGEMRRPTSTSGQRLWEARPRVSADDASAFMAWVRSELQRLKWRMSDLETRAGLWSGFVSKAANGYATVGTDQRARIERVLEAAP